MAYGLKLEVWIDCITPLTVGEGCWMVEVRTRRGADDLRGEEVAGRGMGVIGAGGLGSVFTVAKDGLQAGVCGDGAANDTCEAVDVE